MIKKILIGLALFVAAAAVYAALKPARYLVYREVTIQASPERIFPLINEAKATERWMPWAEMDPAMKMTYSGPDAGVGSKASWDSAGRMGTGSSIISESIDGHSVMFDLEYTKPFQMKQIAQIAILPSGAQSVVRWSVSGRNAFIGRFRCLFINMDKMVGGSFEKGLSKLRTLAESK